MIPLRLEVRDFLSYADPPPLEFDFEVACLTGPNGVGKSAILDAITWSLFGAARGCEGGRFQDRVIRDGAEETTVVFTFALDGARYRVTRQRRRGKTGDLRFEVEGDDGWVSLARASLKETEAVVTSVMRMDYRTFTASAFFVQGRADDFLRTMRPDERKDVLSRLLGLDAYDRLAAAARTKATEAKAERDQLTAAIERDEADLPDVTELETAFEAAETGQAEADERLKEASGRSDAARAALADLEKIVVRRASVAETIQTLDRRQDEARARLDRAGADLTELDRLLARSDELRRMADELDRLRHEHAALEDAAGRAAALAEEMAELDRVIAAEGRAAEERLGHVDTRVRDLATAIASAEEAARELADLEPELERAEDLRCRQAEMNGEMERLVALRARLTEQDDAARRETSAVTDRIRIVEAGGGECPVCGGRLDGDHRERLLADLRVQMTELEASSARREAEATSADEARRALDTESQTVAAELARLTDVSARCELLRDRTKAAPDLASQLRDAEAEAAAIRATIDDGSYASVERARRAELDRQRSTAYDADRHAAVRARMAELAHVDREMGRIESAASERERLIETKTEAASTLEAMVGERTGLDAELATLDERLGGLEAARAEVASTEAAVREASAVLQDCTTTLAAVAQRIETFRRAQERLEEQRRGEREAADRHRRYVRLTTAFGRGGVPDLIIGNALPELTTEANDILGRLTDYEMSVQFPMERELRSGGVKDTFDVLVHHGSGVREFEMFSGGEAFRIAFAVRLGLSKLLVRRAGARLQTLIIDEGFGTQDPQGRERLVEAINLARSEFEKVLVITHLDDLKDAFGAQIHVTKAGATSSFVVSRD